MSHANHLLRDCGRLIRNKLTASQAFTRKAGNMSEMKSWAFCCCLNCQRGKKKFNPAPGTEKSAQQKIIPLRVKN